MAYDIRKVKTMTDLIGYFSQNLRWNIDVDDFDDIEDISYDFEAEDIGLKEEAFAKISSLRQLQPLVDGQRWGIFCVEFDSDKFEVTALRKILSGLVPKRRNSADHAVWDQKDLMFICNWGKDNNRTIGIAHFEDKDSGLPQIKMISCAPAMEDTMHLQVFEKQLSQLAWPKNTNNIEAWRESWAAAFVSGYRQAIHDSVTLTVQLAAEAQNIRNRILDILDVESRNGYVHLLYEKFRNTLIHDMTETQFADMYAQTVVYGLFSARCMDQTQGNFSAEEAIDCIPNTNPFLKSLMKECLGSENNTKLSFDELEIGNVVELLRNTRIEAIIQDFNRQTGGGREDPVIHFYEEFLTAYDKAQKVQRGVFYTPQPVVNFMVRAVDSIIKEQFGLRGGLASEETKKIKVKRKSYKKRAGQGYTEIEEQIDVPAIQVLDPATGTGTFLRQVILQIYENFKATHKGLRPEQLAAEWNKYVPEQLLPRLNGFELMMAPYAVAHMKLAMVLKDTGYDFSGENRLNVFLTNSLEQPGSSDMQLTFFDDPLAIESIEANGVKKNEGINVVIGNPPYSGESANKNEWILEMMEPYKKEPGGLIKLNERNPKWLNDDYVKFIRYAQSIIDRSNSGVIAYINPHGFVGNPTFRGMRWNLLQSFDEIYIIDLHGNSNRKETCPDGSKDENVFDIQQGVCICIFVKQQNRLKRNCRVFHADVYGTRDHKNDFLNSVTLSDIQFSEVSPTGNEYFFHPVNLSSKSDYDKGFSVDELFTLGSVGIVTARDNLTIDFSKTTLLDRVDAFRKMNSEIAREKYSLGKDVRDWKVVWAQDDINNNGLLNGTVNHNLAIPIMYRIFDKRYIFYTGTSRGFVCYPRNDVMRQFLVAKNLGLATARSNKSDSCDHFYVTNTVMEAKCAERTTQSAVFPLYSYSTVAGKQFRTVNFDKEIANRIVSQMNLIYVGDAPRKTEAEVTAEDIFFYIYGVLYSRNYRKRYAEFLKVSFPKIPYPTDAKKFWSIHRIGRQLVELHLMEMPIPLNNNVAFVNADGTMVIKATFKDGKVYIGKKSYFSGVSEKDWSFIIGGYQPLQRWFKERKGSELSTSDVEHYCQMIQVIKNTILLMDELETLI